MKKPVKKVAPAPSKVRSYDVSADAPLKPLKPKRPGVPASLRRDPPKVSQEKVDFAKADRAATRARQKSGEAAGDYGRFFDAITKGGVRHDMDEAERLEKVTDLTLSLEATVSKRDDVDLVEGLVAATTCYNRGVGAFLPLFERQKNAYKNELLWRLKVRREAALGNPPPVRITKERPVYGKAIDARPKKVVAPVKPSKPMLHKALPPAKPVKQKR